MVKIKTQGCFLPDECFSHFIFNISSHFNFTLPLNLITTKRDMAFLLAESEKKKKLFGC